jgi:hypothetical protein
MSPACYVKFSQVPVPIIGMPYWDSAKLIVAASAQSLGALRTDYATDNCTTCLATYAQTHVGAQAPIIL